MVRIEHLILGGIALLAIPSLIAKKNGGLETPQISTPPNYSQASLLEIIGNRKYLGGELRFEQGVSSGFPSIYEYGGIVPAGLDWRERKAIVKKWGLSGLSELQRYINAGIPLKRKVMAFNRGNLQQWGFIPQPND